MLKTAVVADRRYLKHFAGRVHPERPQRIEVLIDMAESLKRPGLELMAPREATLAELGLCHSPAYVQRVGQTAMVDRFDFDHDTHTSRDSYATAILAAGGVLRAVEAVMAGEADNAFAIVRPPGHHALPARAMGFCLFNNIAIAAARLLRQGLKRVMIVDWDVHHGNGTEEIFYEAPEVLYVSTHQFPHFPGTGSFHEIGAGAGEGYTVNLPMPANCGDAEYLRMFDELVVPIGRKFKPEFILVSAGFDCHLRDPIAAMCVTEDGFTAMARRVKNLAAECAGGKMVAALEGGYDLQALAASGRAVIEEFGRDGGEAIRRTEGGDTIMPIVERVAHNVGRFWGMG